MSSPTLPLVFVRHSALRGSGLAKGAVLGLVLSVLSLAAGVALEGGRLPQLLQSTACLVVCGGTLGAVMLQYPLPAILDAMRAAWLSLRASPARPDEDVRRLQALGMRVRRDRDFSFEREADASQADTSADMFLAHALRLLAENQAATDLGVVLEQMADSFLEQQEDAAAVFEAAGGFSPTMGLLGAVLGLVQVMNHLGGIDEIGRGIAIAFTATIYGVAAANLVLLPLAGRIRVRAQQLRQARQVLIQGILCIAARLSPAEMEVRMSICADSHGGRVRLHEKRLRPQAGSLRPAISRSGTSADRPAPGKRTCGEA